MTDDDRTNAERLMRTVYSSPLTGDPSVRDNIAFTLAYERTKERARIVAFLRRYARKEDLSERESLILRDAAAMVEGQEYRSTFPVTLEAAALHGEAGR